MLVVFTDLDGTLLDGETYSFEAALPALERCRKAGVPVVLCSSKTRAEMLYLREQMRLADPFVSENGGAVFIPPQYFSSPVEEALHRDGWLVIELGMPSAELRAALRRASAACGCPVRSMSEMTLEEISERCSLPLEQAARAALREYGEPFVILDSRRGATLLAALEAEGLRWTQGDRFYHVLAGNDKGAAVRRLAGLYRREFGDVIAVGLGDAPNDAPLLEAVDVAFVVRGRISARLQEVVPQAKVTEGRGPEGWKEAVLSLLT